MPSWEGVAWKLFPTNLHARRSDVKCLRNGLFLQLCELLETLKHCCKPIPGGHLASLLPVEGRQQLLIHLQMVHKLLKDIAKCHKRTVFQGPYPLHDAGEVDQHGAPGAVIAC